MLKSYGLIGFIVLQRLCELLYAYHNTKKLKARGAIEKGRSHYGFMVTLHGAWIVLIAVSITPDTTINLIYLIIFFALQGMRGWILWSLGSYWTTRLLSIPNHPIITRGPYKFFKHPNYMLVVAEIAVFPLIFNFVFLAIGFSLLNLLILGFRLREENSILYERT